MPARNEAGNIEAAISRPLLMGKRTEFIFVEGALQVALRTRFNVCP